MFVCSLIICTHNPGPYLQRALDGLRAQSLPTTQWELLLIDNASSERLSDVWDLSWHPNARHVREDLLGLTPARLRGVAEARGELLVFVDDDNVLASDYLERAVSIADRHQWLGVFGAGMLEPEFEIAPPPELLPLCSMLALRTVRATVWTNNAKDVSCLPWGAGLCVRHAIARLYRDVVDGMNTAGVLDRRGDQLFCGGDDLFSWVAAGSGHGFGLFPELRLLHIITKRRLNRSYFLRLMGDHAFSHGVLRYLLFGELPSRVKPRDWIRTPAHGLLRGWFSMRCRWEALLGAHRAARFVSERRLQPLPAKLSRSETLAFSDSKFRTTDAALHVGRRH
jgi:glycosyltransferase involved in cell wall biosynthesis